MSISATISSMQTIHSDITGISSAPTTYPGALKTADLPEVLMFPTDGQWTQTTASKVGYKKGQQIRRYRVNVYVDPVGQGEGVDEGTQTVITLLQRFGEKYLDVSNNGIVSGQDYPMLSNKFSDTGLTVLTYAGTDYRGFVYTIDVLEMIDEAV